MIIDILKKMNIHDLRTTARLVGVKAPTTKKADKLIEEIILIKNKKMEPIKSNMGRPPKLPKKNRLVQYILDSLLYENHYEPITREKNVDFYLRSNDNYQNIIPNCLDFMGVVREYEDEKYIKNYLRDNSYCMFENEQGNLVDIGDIIIGKYENEDLFGKIISFEKKDLNVSEEKGAAFVKEIETNEDMYQYISMQDGINIVVEVEAVLNRNKKNDNNTLYFSTKECADIKESYNLLLDVKELVDNLCSKNKQFSLYFIDVEYIYSILSMYYKCLKQEMDLNAGQYFKEILSKIKNSNGAKVTLFEKKQGRRSAYFDIIINRYCEKI